MKVILFCVSPVIKVWEKSKIDHFSQYELKHQPIFIIGAPRTGSTILYQILTNRYSILYINNLICKLSKHLFFGFWLSNFLFKDKAHNCFESVNGSTAACGYNAPSECGDFWYRWLPKDRHFIDDKDITDEMVLQIRKELVSIINYFDKPLIIKNLNAGQRLRLINKIFPEAKYIFIKRAPLKIANSIYKARKKLDIAENEIWSVKPKNYKELEKLPIFEKIVKQIFYIEKQINDDLYQLSIPNKLIINFDYFQNYFAKSLQEIIDFLGNVSDRKTYNHYEISPLKSNENDTGINKQFEQQIEKFDWNNYSGS